MDFRKDFFEIMCHLAVDDDKIRILTGDLGYSFCEKFAEIFPNQFINCGIAEQSMVGIASGMARGGLKPYVYSNAIFLLSRANEQIRDDVAYNNQNVKLIGTGASGFLGFSHNWGENEREELLINGFPNIVYVKPNTREELQEALSTDKPSFIRV